MGSLLQPGKNPFRAVGLVAGLALRLEREAGGELEQLATRVEVVEDGSIAVLVPMRGLQRRPLRLNSRLAALYTFRSKFYHFDTEVVGHSADGELEYLSMPKDVSSMDRRRSYRLPASLVPEALFRVVVNPEDAGQEAPALEGTITDLSEGGVCLSSRQRLDAGEWLGLMVELPGVGYLTARMRVLHSTAPSAGFKNFRHHCAFVDLPKHEQERIARFIARRQRELLRSRA